MPWIIHENSHTGSYQRFIQLSILSLRLNSERCAGKKHEKWDKHSMLLPLVYSLPADSHWFSLLQAVPASQRLMGHERPFLLILSNCFFCPFLLLSKTSCGKEVYSLIICCVQMFLVSFIVINTFMCFSLIPDL